MYKPRQIGVVMEGAAAKQLIGEIMELVDSYAPLDCYPGDYHRIIEQFKRDLARFLAENDLRAVIALATAHAGIRIHRMAGWSTNMGERIKEFSESLEGLLSNA